MGCPFCGAAVRAQMHLCAKCGRRLVDTDRADDPAELFAAKTDPNIMWRGRVLYIGGAVMGGALGFIAGVALTRMGILLIALAALILSYATLLSIEGVKTLPRSIAGTRDDVLYALRRAQVPMLVASVAMWAGILWGNMHHAVNVDTFTPMQQAQVEAAGSRFPQDLPQLHVRLTAINHFIKTGHFSGAEEELVRIRQDLRPVLASSYGHFADVVDFDMQVSATEARLAQARQEMNESQEMRTLVEINHQLDQVDDYIQRAQYVSASTVWSGQLTLLQSLKNPLVIGSSDMESTRRRMDGEKAAITAGLAVRPASSLPTMSAQKLAPRSKHRRHVYSNAP